MRQLPGVEQRVEDGAVQFGDDWPGTFIRGDSSFFYARNLEIAIDSMRKQNDPSLALSIIALTSLLETLDESRV